MNHKSLGHKNLVQLEFFHIAPSFKLCEIEGSFTNLVSKAKNSSTKHFAKHSVYFTSMWGESWGAFCDQRDKVPLTFFVHMET